MACMAARCARCLLAFMNAAASFFLSQCCGLIHATKHCDAPCMAAAAVALLSHHQHDTRRKPQCACHLLLLVLHASPAPIHSLGSMQVAIMREACWRVQCNHAAMLCT